MHYWFGATVSKCSRPVFFNKKMKKILIDLADYLTTLDAQALSVIFVAAIFSIAGILDIIYTILKFIYTHIVLRITTLIYDIYFFLRHYNKK